MNEVWHMERKRERDAEIDLRIWLNPGHVYISLGPCLGRAGYIEARMLRYGRMYGYDKKQACQRPTSPSPGIEKKKGICDGDYGWIDGWMDAYTHTHVVYMACPGDRRSCSRPRVGGGGEGELSSQPVHGFISRSNHELE